MNVTTTTSTSNAASPPRNAHSTASARNGRRRIASDGWAGLPNELDRLKPLRHRLTRLERQRMRELGRTLALAVDLYPRGAGETLDDLGLKPDVPDESPFAALKALKPREK